MLDYINNISLSILILMDICFQFGVISNEAVINIGKQPPSSAQNLYTIYCESNWPCDKTQ